MDPITALGAAAAITQFAGQLASITISLVDLYGRIKEAPELARKQLLYVNRLNVIARSITQNPSLQTEAVRGCLQRCIQTMNKIDQRARKAMESKVQRLTAVITEDKMVKLFDELMRDEMSLLLCIQTIEALMSPHPRDILNTTGVNILQIQEDLRQVSYGMQDSASDMKQTLSGVQGVDIKLSTLDTRLSTMSDAVPAISGTLQDIINEVRVVSMQLERTAHKNLHPDQTYFEIPNRRARNFVGREDVLSKIDLTRRQSSNKIPLVVIRGMGGQGKTQIALEYCFVKRKDPFDAIFWLNATSEITIKSSFETIYETVRPQKIVYTTPEAKIRYVSQWLSERKTSWLLVYDNYDKADYRILDFVPSVGDGFVIITTRNAVTEDIVTEEDLYIDLQGLNDKAALELLARSSSQKLSNGVSIEKGERIVQKLGNHALAIVQAGSYIKSLKLDFSRFLNEYDSRKQKLLKTTPALTEYRRKIGDSPDDREIALNVFTTWELSFQQLVEETSEDSAEVRLLTMFAFLDSQDISELLFRNFDVHLCRKKPQSLHLLEWLSIFKAEDIWSSDIFREALGRLTSLALVQSWDDRDDGFVHATLHPLVATWIKLRTSANNTTANLVAIWHVLGSTTDAHWAHEQKRYTLTPAEQQEVAKHIVVAIESSKKETFSEDLKDDLAWSRWSCADFMFDTGRYTHSATLCRDVLQTWGIEKLADFRVLGVFCASLGGSGQSAEAKKFLDHLVKARQGIQITSGVEKLRTLKIDFWRGRNLVELGEFNEAEALLRDGLSRSVEVTNLDTTMEPRFYGFLGTLAHKRKDYTAAEKYQRIAWLGWVKSHGAIRQATLNTMGELGITLADLGRRDESLRMLEEAMAGLVVMYGPDFQEYIRFKACRDQQLEMTEDSMDTENRSDVKS